MTTADGAPPSTSRRTTPALVWIGLLVGSLAAVSLTALLVFGLSDTSEETPTEERDPTEEEEYRLLQEIGYVK